MGFDERAVSSDGSKTMQAIWQNIWAGLTGASWWEQIATVLGIAGVWLTMRESLWCFPVGLVQVAIFGWVCWAGKLYSETILQAWFFVALCYGWWHWSRAGGSGDSGNRGEVSAGTGGGEDRGGKTENEGHPRAATAKVLPVQRLGRREGGLWALATLILWAGWSEGMARWTDAALPHWDGAVFALSVTAQWLQARKYLENWLGWLLANTLAVGLFVVKEYYWFAVLYCIFWLLALAGWRAWWASWRRSHAV